MKQKPPSRIQGFTLVELMVVIVIMAIMASLVMLNINGVDQRKAAQARDFFIMDVQKIAREANDQARVLALEIYPATDVADFSYAVVEYKNPQLIMQAEQQNNVMLNHQKWQKYNEFPQQMLAKNVSFAVQSLDYDVSQAQNDDLTQENAPKLIWLGNGEAKPVRIQFYYANEPVGAEIEIDHLGKINAS
ncbi:MAG: type II secretion system GspH family protein [Acinetobacter sp.]|nr:type II secretion system GspH family protein [Acinetobacter sp.]